MSGQNPSLRTLQAIKDLSLYLKSKEKALRVLNREKIVIFLSF